MKRYEKPMMAVTRFTTQETIANAYTGTPSVGNEPVDLGNGNTVTVPVTTYEITSLGATSSISVTPTPDM